MLTSDPSILLVSLSPFVAQKLKLSEVQALMDETAEARDELEVRLH